MALVAAIDEKLRGGGDPRSGQSAGALNPINLNDDGRLGLAAKFVQRLADGDHRRGQQLLERVIADIRVDCGGREPGRQLDKPNASDGTRHGATHHVHASPSPGAIPMGGALPRLRASDANPA